MSRKKKIAAAIDAAETVSAEDSGILPELSDGSDIFDPATPLTGRAALIAECAKLDHSDTDNGQRLMKHFGKDLLVLAYEGVRNDAFVTWIGTHWDMRNGDDAALRVAQNVGGFIRQEARYLTVTPDERRILEEFPPPSKQSKPIIEGLNKRKASRHSFGVSSKNKARIDNMLKSAAPHLTRQADAWDPDPLMFATKTHTITLRKEDDGAQIDVFEGHRREDMISRIVPVVYDPSAKCKKWDEFLKRFLPNLAVRNFVQVFTGLGLTGLPIQKLIFHYGSGANGKSVFLEVLTRVLGELACTLQSETVTGIAERSAQGASPDLARMHNRRFVRIPELPANEPLREALVKKITGGEAIPVRNLFKGLFDFVPVCKAHMSGNAKPKIDGTDNGIWRRICVVKWPVTLEEDERRDFAEVVNEFMAEAPGILNWMIDGALIYLADGLIEPPEVKMETQEYRDDMDPVGRFVQSCIEVAYGEVVTGAEMYAGFEQWCEANGTKPMSGTKFGTILKTKLPRTDGRVQTYENVRLRLPDRPRNPDHDGYGG